MGKKWFFAKGQNGFLDDDPGEGKKWFFAKGQSGYVKEESEEGKFVFVKGQTGYFDNDGDDGGGGGDKPVGLYRLVCRGDGGDTSWISPADQPDKHLSLQDILDLGFKKDEPLGLTEIYTGKSTGRLLPRTSIIQIRYHNTQDNQGYSLSGGNVNLRTITDLSQPLSFPNYGIQYSSDVYDPIVPVILLSAGHARVINYTPEIISTVEQQAKHLCPQDLLDMGLKDGAPLLFRTKWSETEYVQKFLPGFLRESMSLTVGSNDYDASSLTDPYLIYED